MTRLPRTCVSFPGPRVRALAGKVTVWLRALFRCYWLFVYVATAREINTPREFWYDYYLSIELDSIVYREPVSQLTLSFLPFRQDTPTSISHFTEGTSKQGTPISFPCRW